jgi:hypothetical protein
MLRLLTSTVSKPDDGERGQVGRLEVRLHLDAARLEADDGGGEGAGEHTTDGTWNVVTTVNRLRAESVPSEPGTARRERAGRSARDDRWRDGRQLVARAFALRYVAADDADQPGG